MTEILEYYHIRAWKGRDIHELFYKFPNMGTAKNYAFEYLIPNEEVTKVQFFYRSEHKEDFDDWGRIKNVLTLEIRK